MAQAQKASEVRLRPDEENGGIPKKLSQDVQLEAIVIGEVQLILAEKRTSLAAMRTGIAVFTLPLSVLSILVATSKYYSIPQVMPFLLPLLTLCAALVILGSYLVIRSMLRIHYYDRLITKIKAQHSRLAQFIN